MKKIVLLTIILMSSSLYAGGYNANAAVKYAKKWVKTCGSYGCPQNWNTREFSEYDSYSGGATDCANFVSQSLLYGGKSIDMTDDDDYDYGWYENYDEENIRHADFWYANVCTAHGDQTDKGDSIAWVRASALRARFAYGYTSRYKISSQSRTKVGDIVFFRLKSDNNIKRPSHVGIITKKRGSRAYFSAHTHDRYNYKLNSFTNKYYFEFYRPRWFVLIKPVDIFLYWLSFYLIFLSKLFSMIKNPFFL